MTLAYKLISAWFILTTPVILWDAGYVMETNRPRSMVGGDLHWIWKPYALYQEVDYVYGVRALENNEGFTSAQSLLNLIETAMNVYYVYLADVVGSPSAPVIGFAAVTMTFSKTVLYWAQEYFCTWCSIGHNSLPDLLLLWILPNGQVALLWILFPGLIMYKFGKDIGAGLRANALLQKNVKKE
ncbi:hypothetical protein BU17DRAFT_52032 [Hysterangium stoloniferum]|nr:hypothetical protein BU17DRAFT_52032 [Hysterangium stoloniferum]